MKKLLVFVLLSLSAQAFSQTCYVDLVDKTTLRILRSFTAVGNPDGCTEGMRECRKAIRFDYSNNPQYPNGTLDCVRPADVGPTPMPLPTPRPTPVPPRPQPRPDLEYPTHIRTGETVYNVSNGRYAVVMGVDYQGKFLLRFTDTNQTGGGWDRTSLAPLRGCDLDICVNDEVYNTSNGRYAKVVGLQLGNKFVLKFHDSGLTGAGWDRANIALLNGCALDLCVNDEVYNTSNGRYARIVGLQTNGKYILKFNDSGLTGAGWERANLAVLRGCAGDLCVNEEIYNTSNGRFATIVGLQENGKYVLKFKDSGLSGAGWERLNIAVMKGCQQGLCVGMRVYNQSNGRYARVQALQMGNKFVLTFEDSGLSGAGWELRNLVAIR